MQTPPINILLADDDENDRMIFQEAFEEIKIKTSIHTVNNGIQLMEYLKTKNTNLPDILFLDLNMPRKNGLECLREIRNDKKLNDISIAIYSTSASEKDIEETFRLGANVYINKPTDFAILKQALAKAIVTAYQFQNKPFNKENFLLRI